MFALVAGKAVAVGIKANGSFICLYCGTEQKYQHRIWESTTHVFFIPIGITRGECVLCLSCESAFRLESLDETSTATCDELIMEVPMNAPRVHPAGTEPIGGPAPPACGAKPKRAVDPMLRQTVVGARV